MNKSINIVSALLFVFAISLFGCGGGSGGGIPAGGTQVTSKGAIEKFGSITVNGVEFSTKGAKLFLPDDTAKPERILQSETEIVDNKLLKLGMVVTVKGVLDDNGVSGKATEIEFRDNLKARIDVGGVDLVNNTITVMGQKIALDDKIKPLLASLKPGDVVQISGLPDDKGGLRATFIEKKDLAEIAQLPEFEMKGFVSSVSGNTAIIKLDPAAATGVAVTFPAGTAPAVGAFIEVKIPKTSTIAADGSFTTTVAPHLEDINVNPTPAAPGVQVSIEGFPSSGTVLDFMLNGQKVVTNDLTIFVGGAKTDFALTKKIQAEGVIAGGVMTASKIAFKATVFASPVISSGEIERLGSVVVNGVEFRTTGAVLHLPDDKTARVLQTETEIHGLLKLGMVVTVRGGLDDNGITGAASEIEFKDSLEGKIESVDNVNKTITVMGQTVRIEDNVTRLNDDNAKIFTTAGFLKDDFVEVSGFIDDNGGLRATRVFNKKAAGEFEVKGFVVSIGAGTFTLSLPGGNVTVTGTLPTGAIVGSIVEVKANAAPAGGALTATVVQLEDRLGEAAEKVEVEGIITSVAVDNSSFMINGKNVTLAASTLFEGGLKTDLAAGLKVEAEGPLDANGAIAAVKVMFRSNIKIEADVTAFIAGSSLTVLGKPVAINSFTKIVGNLTGVGNHVEVRAYLDRNGMLVASRIVLKNADKTRVFLQGPVTLTGGAMTILGTTVVTNSSSQFRISTDQLATDLSITSAVFIAKVKSGVTVVKVRWATSDTTQSVEEAEIQLGSK